MAGMKNQLGEAEYQLKAAYGYFAHGRAILTTYGLSPKMAGVVAMLCTLSGKGIDTVMPLAQRLITDSDDSHGT